MARPSRVDGRSPRFLIASTSKSRFVLGVAIALHPGEDFGTGVVDDAKIAKTVEKLFDFRPRAIVETLDLLRPIYRKTAAYGHFGREEPELTWERTDMAEILRDAAGL